MSINSSLIAELGERNIQAHKLADKFRRKFGVSLVRYWNPVFGFDVVLFDDEVIKAPDGKSTRQCVRQRYGAEGESIIQQLIAL